MNIKRSLVFQIIIGITLIMTVLLAVLALSNWNSFKVVTKNTVDSLKSSMVIYIKDMENNLGNVSIALNEISATYIDEIYNYNDDNELELYLTSVKLNTILNAKISHSNVADCIFFINPKTNLYVSQFSNRIYGSNKYTLNEYLKNTDTFSNDAMTEQWHIVEISGAKYLIQTYKISQIYMGAMIKVDTLMLAMKKTPVQQNTQYILTDIDGNILDNAYDLLQGDVINIPNNTEIMSNYKGKYFIITENIPICQAKLSCVKESKEIYLGLQLMQWIILLLGILSIVFIAFCIVYLFKNIVKPIRSFLFAYKEVEGGNWNYKMQYDSSSTEFDTMNHSFNSMVLEVKNLKINAYEEKIELQKAELKYLQMQIKPHFYLNAITTISSLAHQNRNDEILKFIDALSTYLRYMLTGGLVNVSIKEEIEHAKDYICLQKIKYPDNIYYMIEIDPAAENVMLPKFLVQTFVENIFKYAFTYGKMLSVFIKAEPCTKENEDFVRITIDDNGDGFPEEILRYNEEQNITQKGKMGIANIKKTLSLLYSRNDLLHISNCEPFGARVRILIPFDKEGIQ